jgi:DNA-binding NarL/FixJ family response regulator
MVRQGLKRILEGAGDLEVVGEAGDGLELLDLLNHSNPDMVILDVSMPRLRGIEAIHEIKTMHPEVSILMLTMHKDKEYLYLALSAGAKGYLLKEDADRDLFSAIEKIRQ